MTICLGIVVPCYNEQEVLPETGRRLMDLIDRMASIGLVTPESPIYFVDDGSCDQTWNIIEEFSGKEQRIHGIKLSRNRGHQNALMAGLFNAKADAIVTVDADLQDDINVIEDMVREHLSGAEIVYGVRKGRKTDAFFKRVSAELFYKMMSLMGAETVYNHADFRLIGVRALSCLESYSEVNLFLRGIIPLIGFNSATVYYDRAERFAGESKYPLRRMITFALDGITSFSITPLRIITGLGIMVCGLSLLMMLWIMIGKWFLNSVLPGWASSTIAIYFLGGVQLLSIGVIGEYVAKIYMETKRRPRYFIEKTL